jgi:ribosomal protein S18 acetylase RimI-like enzyme
MEIANGSGPVVRQSTEADSGPIAALMKVAKYRHSHVDWRLPGDWLNTPGFVVCENTQGKEMNKLVGCLTAAADPPPCAWIRLAAVHGSGEPTSLLARMLEQVLRVLPSTGVNQVAWLAADPWPEDTLSRHGFRPVNWIETYVKEDLEGPVNLENDTPKSVTIRAVKYSELNAMAEIDELAFTPMWRHSLTSLKVAYGEALSFDMVVMDEQPVGFQYSIRGQEFKSAHLVRITVSPEVQGSGVGTALMISALDSYRAQGIRRVSLNTQVDNVSSHKLYEKFGFHRSGDQLPVWALTL